jgi:hypothetical protein
MANFYPVWDLSVEKAGRSEKFAEIRHLGILEMPWHGHPARVF